jgi:dinuclear metal center YbgI/SA1388 family protein
MKTSDLTLFLTQFLQPAKFSDYCPNGLQVEGRAETNKIVTGVTASMALLEAAKAANADTILVHHGYFWRGENMAITGIKQRRIKFLLENNLNLYAYHLPLDAHPQIGNNVMLGKVLGLEIAGYLDDKNMLPFATLSAPIPLSEVTENIANKLHRAPQVIGEPQKNGTNNCLVHGSCTKLY